MKIFNYNNVSGHILFNLNGLVVLFDTGAPNSIGDELFSFIDMDYTKLKKLLFMFLLIMKN